MNLLWTTRLPRLSVMALVASVLFTVLFLSGCSTNRYLEERESPWDPLTRQLRLMSRRGPKPTDRTLHLLRRYDLVEEQEKDLGNVLARLQDELIEEPSLDKIYAVAELAYIGAKKADVRGLDDEAKQLYAIAVSHAYAFLFDDRPEFLQQRNAYDPQFRLACDLYNQSLEGSLRLINDEQGLRPGQTITTRIGDQEYRVKVELRGKWHDDDVERLEFVSDYRLKSGLTNRHHSFGLGVPMIAIRRPHDGESAAELYYPPGVSFAVTAFLRVDYHRGNHDVACVLELLDPVANRTIDIAGREVPLESDLTIPLAYFLDTPEFNEQTNTGTIGLLNPNRTEQARGIYMVEPYQPDKIPVLLVHGLWSSPVTWMEMFNDLRSFPEIRENYQFWFYLYPTGEPYWLSASQMRKDLAQIREDLDPIGANPSLGQMVLVGHSMGGLLSRLQTIHSGNDFWHLLSESPFQELEASASDKEKLAELVFFSPNPAIRRVVTIGTPYRGSKLSNDYTQWLGRKLIQLPTMFVQENARIVRSNPDLLRNTELLTVTTSVDSLSPKSQVTRVVLDAERAPWVTYHNIVGVLDRGALSHGDGDERGDGVVSLASARMEDTVSELTVNADHMTVHQEPSSILEVRRILLEHLVESRQQIARPNVPGPVR